MLATDHTIEHEWRAMLTGIEGVAFYESRLWNSASITPETLAEMERDIAYATKLIRPGERIDVMAFACTSGAMVIGDEDRGQSTRGTAGHACTTRSRPHRGMKALGAAHRAADAVCRPHQPMMRDSCAASRCR